MDVYKNFADQASLLKNISDSFGTDNSGLQQTISAGGGLSNSLGFSSDSGLTGMLPETLNAVLKGRGELMNQDYGAVKGLADLNEMLNGQKDEQAALRTAMRDSFQAKDRMDLQDNAHMFEAGLTDKKLGQEWQQLQAQIAATKAIHDATNASEDRRHADTMALAKQKLNLEARRQKSIETATQGTPGMQSSYFPASPDLYTKYEQEKQNYAKGSISNPDGDRRGYVIAHLKQQALGTPYGTTYDAGTYGDTLGYSQLRLAPNGWYGVVKDPKTGALSYSTTPVVPLSASSVPTKGTTGKSSSLYNVYGNSEE